VNTAIVMNMLLALHHQGMTLIMVTHDMNMKFFSDRVIWLRDGKIMRIETVSSRHRVEAERNLYQSLKELGVEVAEDSHLASSACSSPDEQEAHEDISPRSRSSSSSAKGSVDSLSRETGAFQVTQLRAPTDYPMHPHHDPLTAKPLTNFI
jgi:energy-coupling factor transporter ATP-binding protein EcfA2